MFFTGLFLRLQFTDLAGLSESQKEFFEDKNGMQYFQESDSYYNYRMASNFLKNGYLGDKVINGVVWDSYSYFPSGVPLDYPPLLSWLSVLIFKIINFFSSVSFYEICFYLPGLLSPLCGVIGFLFVRRIAGDLGGFLTGMLLVSSIFYCLKTMPGFFDTDMFIIIFPLLIIWSLLESNRAKIYKNKIILASLAGVFMFLFAMAWNGWQYLFYCILIAFLLYGVIGKKQNWDLRYYPFLIICFFGISLILIGLTNPINVYKLVLGPLEYFDVINSNYNIWYPWPDTYKNVAELEPATIGRVLYFTGPLTVILGLCGVILLSWNEFRNKNSPDKLGRFCHITLLVWTLMSILSLTKGVRFIGLLLPPLAVFSGILIGLLFGKFQSMELPFNKTKKWIIGFFIVLIIISPQIIQTHNTSKIVTPLYNDHYAESAEWILNNTPNNTVIITDWSYGHFYAEAANRPVSYDGRLGYIETLPVRWIEYTPINMSTEIPNTSRDYWISLGLNTDNSTLARGIFIMLASSGDEAYLTTDTYTKNTTKSILILEDILGLSWSSAKRVLQKKYGFSDQQSKEILKYSHPVVKRPFIVITMNNSFKSGKNNTFKLVYQNKIINIWSL
ncbi:STT3 domain-containing protein [Methanobacterium alcaliphilum]|uniref:STT3 domain-containing protein n=1 Tax=Methanobacterium alcaliphilum TaxID=392018 RepID=UPI00318329F7